MLSLPFADAIQHLALLPEHSSMKSRARQQEMSLRVVFSVGFEEERGMSGGQTAPGI